MKEGVKCALGYIDCIESVVRKGLVMVVTHSDERYQKLLYALAPKRIWYMFAIYIF